MPIPVKELENLKRKDEFYAKPTKDKILLFLQNNKEKGFTIREIVNNLEKERIPQGKDSLSQLLAFMIFWSYITELNSLKKEGKIVSYNYNGTEYYYCKDGGYW